MRLLWVAVSVTAAVGGGGVVSALTPAEWRSQTIYQVLTDRFARTDGSTTFPCDTGEATYCGGTWRGIAQRLDYIQGLGATAVWISPFVQNIQGKSVDGESYHGYWAQDIWRVNPLFGTPEDLVELSDALHARGMYLMADVVTNHMAWRGPGNTVDYSIYHPFSDSSDYHLPPCVIDYSSQVSVERCWQGSDAVSLPDLRTEDPRVRLVFNTWIKRAVLHFGFDGLRLDSAKHVEMSFWPPFEAAAGVFSVGEVFHGDPAYVAPYQDVMSGLMNYPVYYWVTQAFESTAGSIANLANGVRQLAATARDLTLYGGFLENHDQPRFANLTSDRALLKNALAFTLLMDGIPIIYQGLEQGFSGGDVPYNREALWLSGYDTRGELYGWIATLTALRSTMAALDAGYLFYKALPIYSDEHIIAMRKGFDDSQVVSVYSNVGANRAFGVALGPAQTGFRPCKLVLEVTKCQVFVTDSSGVLMAESGSGEPLVFVPAERVAGTRICAGVTGKPHPPYPPLARQQQQQRSPPRPKASIVAFRSADNNLDFFRGFNNNTSLSCLAARLFCELTTTTAATISTTKRVNRFLRDPILFFSSSFFF